MDVIRSTPIAPNANTNITIGILTVLNKKKPMTTKDISTGVETALVNIGLYRAESNRPTTAALIPQTAPAIFGFATSDSHVPCKPRRSKKPGKNIATVANTEPKS